jgi:hypothetical protein
VNQVSAERSYCGGGRGEGAVRPRIFEVVLSRKTENSTKLHRMVNYTMVRERAEIAVRYSVITC